MALLSYIQIKNVITARAFCAVLADNTLEPEYVFTFGAFDVNECVLVFSAVFHSCEERFYFHFDSEVRGIFGAAALYVFRKCAKHRICHE